MYTPKTLADAQQSLSDRHDNGTVPSNTTILAKYTRLLNRGQEYCSDRMRLNKTTTVTVTSGVGTLPADFLICDTIYDSSDNEYTKISPQDIQNQSTSFTFWITGNQTDGFVLNSYDDGTYTVPYIYKPASMVNPTDVCVIPDIEAIVAYAYAMLRKSESDPFEDSALSLQECDARISEMNSAYNINTNALGFEIY